MLELQKTNTEIKVSYPASFWNKEKIQETLKASDRIHSWNIAASSDSKDELTIRTSNDDQAAAVNRVFATLNDYPYHDPSLIETHSNSEAPLVSCILLLPFNDVFARNVILPSIIENSKGYPIEIIIVYSGVGVDLERLRNFRIIESEFGCISKGYNKGVEAARGKYVALFHDDCIIYDRLWISKCLESLTDNVKAVAAESDTYGPVVYGKAVPLFLEREDYLSAGGYHEYYYVGVEDIDLACSFLGHGQKMAYVDMDYLHLRGMGSSLIVHENPRQLKLLFGYQVLPRKVISRVHDDCMKQLVAAPFIKLLEAQYYLRFFERHAKLLKKLGMQVEERIKYFQQRRHSFLLRPEIAYVNNRTKLIEAYKGLMNLDELAVQI